MKLNPGGREQVNSVPRRLMTVLLVALALFIAACGGGSNGAKTQPKVTLILALTGLTFAHVVQAGAQAAADETGTQLTVVGPPSLDPTTEAKLFEDALRSHPSGILIHPVPPDFFGREFKEASSANVPVAPFEFLPANHSTIPLLIANDHRESGRIVANAVADRLIQKLGPNPHGSIVLSLCVPGLQSMVLTIAGEKEVFAQRLPNVQLIGPLLTDSEPTKNFAAWQAIIQAHPNALAYMGRCDPDGPSLVKLKTQMHGTFEITSWDVAPETLQGIKDGVMLATMPEPFFLEGYIPTRLFAEAAKNGKPLPHGWYNPRSQLATSTNIDAVIKRESSIANGKAYFQQQIDQFFSDPQKYLHPLSEFPQP